MQSRVSSHPTEQSMCIPQESLCVRHSSQELGTYNSRQQQQQGNGNPVHRNTWAANRASCCCWVIPVENLYCSVQTIPVLLSPTGRVGKQIVRLQSLWSQLSQWLTGRFTTGLHLCFSGSENNLLHLPLSSAQGVKYKYTGYIPTPQNGMVPLKWSAPPTIHWKHTAPVFVTKDSSCAIPILTHHHWLLCNFPKGHIGDTSTYFHMTFHFNFCIKSQALIQKQSYLFY